MRVMIVVTHLLGTGHLSRALTLGRAFAAAGDAVTVVSGGGPVPHLDATGIQLVQLAPLRSDGVDFARLLDAAGDPADAGTMAARREQLLGAFKATAPDLLITELFPFGRRILRDEFTDLLEVASAQRPRPAICASVRDILAPPSKPAKARLADDLVARFYDAVLVHSDPAITPLEASWPVSPALAGKLRYTGFVAPPAAARDDRCLGAGEVLVTAGGGDVGAHIFDAALQAAVQRPDIRWRLLIGGADAAKTAARRRTSAPANALIEPARPEFRQMLHHAAVSVSMCGYNTALDVLQAGTPALFIPFDAGDEVEQGLRADAMSRLPGILHLPAAELTAFSLLHGVERLLLSPRQSPPAKGFDGTAQTVRIARDLLAALR